MIRQATVEDISSERVTKRHGRVVVVTRYYPRYLRKKLISDYFSVLAPPKELLHEFKEREEKLDDHDAAFEAIDYESKFVLSAEGLLLLQELVESAKTQPVYFVCHCKIGQYCHREILMLAARELYCASIAKVSHEYKTILKRIRSDGLIAPK